MTPISENFVIISSGNGLLPVRPQAIISINTDSGILELGQSWDIIIHENAFENVICKNLEHLFRPRCVKWAKPLKPEINVSRCYYVFLCMGLVQIFGIIIWRINEDGNNNNLVNSCTNANDNIYDDILE